MAQPVPRDPVLEALARAPIDDEPQSPELDAELEQRIADVRAGVPMVPHADVLAKLG